MKYFAVIFFVSRKFLPQILNSLHQLEELALSYSHTTSRKKLEFDILFPNYFCYYCQWWWWWSSSACCRKVENSQAKLVKEAIIKFLLVRKKITKKVLTDPKNVKSNLARKCWVKNFSNFLSSLYLFLVELFFEKLKKSKKTHIREEKVQTFIQKKFQA